MKMTAICIIVGFADNLVGKESTGSIPGSPLKWGRLPTPVFLGFPGGSAGKESTCNAGDLGWIPGLGRSGEGKATHSSIPEFHGLYCPWGCKEWDTTGRLSLSHFHCIIVI